MAEVLYNGIVLPDVWPPREAVSPGDAPLVVPYLDRPPAVIPLTIGRQLFVDDFLVEASSLHRVYGKPRVCSASPVLVPETAEELDDGLCPMAAPFNDGLWYDPADRLYKLWYLPGWFHSTALATSVDGLHWTRPVLDVVPGTNLVWPHHAGCARDGCLVWLDHDGGPAARYKMFQYYRHDGGAEAGWLQTSPDGIHWSDPAITAPVGDNTSLFYNPFRRRWCLSIRRNDRHSGLRARAYRETAEFGDLAQWDPAVGEVPWLRCDRFDLPHPEVPDHPVALYDVNVAPYESLLVGLLAVFRGPENDICAREGVPKHLDLEVAFSRDGFHFSRPDRTPFLAATRGVGDWNRAYLHAVGGVCLVVGDELRFYFTGFSGLSPRLSGGAAGPGRERRAMYAGGTTGLATLRRDGFAAMAAGHAGGDLLTRPVTFGGRYLFANVQADRGELRAAVLDADGQPLAGYGEADCEPVRANRTAAPVRWRGGPELPAPDGRPVRLRFSLRNGELYSFWVTDDPGGASHGYLAAGGPEATAGRDLPRPS